MAKKRGRGRPAGKTYDRATMVKLESAVHDEVAELAGDDGVAAWIREAIAQRIKRERRNRPRIASAGGGHRRLGRKVAS